MTWSCRPITIPVVTALVGLVMSGLFVSVLADSSATSTPVAVEAARDPMQEVTPERQAAAETFASLHHPELAELLARLKIGRQADYDNAVRELFRESERLAKLKGRDPERYALELEVWKISSRIQLAAARLVMEDSVELRSELLNLLQAKLALRTSLLELDREKAASRLERLDADLANLRVNPSALTEQDLEKLLKAAKARANQAAKPSQGNRAKTAVRSNSSEQSGDADAASAPQTPRGAVAPATAASKN